MEILTYTIREEKGQYAVYNPGGVRLFSVHEQDRAKILAHNLTSLAKKSVGQDSSFLPVPKFEEESRKVLISDKRMPQMPLPPVYHKPLEKIGPEETFCKVCGKRIPQNPYIAFSSKTKVLCSDACRSVASKAQRAGGPIPQLPQLQKHTHCCECGEELAQPITNRTDHAFCGKSRCIMRRRRRLEKEKSWKS
jgi:predicted nucleic acid-binding Zn ribbon protein